MKCKKSHNSCVFSLFFCIIITDFCDYSDKSLVLTCPRCRGGYRMLDDVTISILDEKINFIRVTLHCGLPTCLRVHYKLLQNLYTTGTLPTSRRNIFVIKIEY